MDGRSPGTSPPLTTRHSQGLKVAQLIESDGPGGAERVVVHLARALQEGGGQSIVFLPPKGEGWIEAELQGSGVAIDHFHLEQPLSPSCAQTLAESFARHQIDVAHSHEFSMAVYGAWAARRARVPHVITMHGARYYAARLRRRLALGAAVRASARTVAVSSGLAGHLRRDLWLSSSRVLMIPNGVPYAPPAQVRLRDELHLGPDDRLMVAIGNLYPVKGHRHLIEAFALVAHRHPTLHCAIGGRGHLDVDLDALARRHGLAGRMHLLGLRSDVPAILAAADLFVQPSLSEGLPLALLEAMQAGLPIVATDVGEVAVALGFGDAGMLVAPGSPGALAAAIDSLLNDPMRAELLGARAAARARAEYGVSRMADRYIGMYSNL
jgi:glycosyltransferase involved in cell wall biosynthesis